jgi:hypothetical protein
MAKKKIKAFELECPNKKCRGKVFEITRKMEGKEKGTVVKEVIECPYCHQSAPMKFLTSIRKKRLSSGASRNNEGDNCRKSTYPGPVDEGFTSGGICAGHASFFARE